MIYVYQISIYPHQSILKIYDIYVILEFYFLRWPDDYKVGLTKKILLDLNITNTGENAYDTQCFIQLPAGVEYVSSNSSATVREDSFFIFFKYFS
jgi:hypothetical protein